MTKILNIKSIVIAILISSYLARGQSEQPYQIKRDSSFIEFFDSTTTSDNYFAKYRNTLGLSSQNSFSIFKTKVSEDGSKHVFYQQYYDNIPIQGSRLVLHDINNKLKYITGIIIPELNISTSINYDKPSAISIGLNWIKQQELQKMGTTFKLEDVVVDTVPAPEAKLCIFNVSNTSTASYKTVYLVSASFIFPFEDFFYCVVDAETGQALNYFSGYLSSSPGQVTTVYYGQRTVDAEWGGSVQKYRLIDDSRGNGIKTKKCRTYLLNCLNQYLNDSDNDWDDDFQKRIHASTQWAAGNVWDYYLNVLNRNGPDEGGKGLDIRTDIPGDVNDFGNKCSPTQNPMTIDLKAPISGKTNPRVSINSIGHEFTHGVVSDDAGWNTVNLFGQENSESYAMMEGYCDVFAEFAEYNFQGWVDWRYDAESLIQSSDWRVYTDPVLNGKQAMFYGDNNWNVNSEGHHRAGVLQHWAFMLSVGETSTNHLSNAYCVKGIGIKKVEKILYNVMNQGYLQNSSYNDLKFSTYAVIANLYGQNSNEMAQAYAAWYAIGISQLPTFPINVQNLTINNQQDFHYNTKISLINITTNPGANFYVSSNTEIELTSDMNLNSGTFAELYIGNVCAGSARMGNTNPPNPTISDVMTEAEIVKRNNKIKNIELESIYDNFVVKPNPSSGNFQLILNGDYELPNKIIIRTVLGSTIKTIENPSSIIYNFDIQKEASGVYMISVYFDDKVVNKRIIKQ
jgi:Zn-dependent metalloprotease